MLHMLTWGIKRDVSWQRFFFLRQPFEPEVRIVTAIAYESIVLYTNHLGIPDRLQDGAIK